MVKSTITRKQLWQYSLLAANQIIKMWLIGYMVREIRHAGEIRTVQQSILWMRGLTVA